MLAPLRCNTSDLHILGAESVALREATFTNKLCRLLSLIADKLVRTEEDLRLMIVRVVVRLYNGSYS